MILLPLTIRFPVPFVLPPDGFFFSGRGTLQYSINERGTQSDSETCVVAAVLYCCALLTVRLLCFLKLLSSSVRHTLFFYAFLSLTSGRPDSPTALGTGRSKTDDPKYCTSPLQLCTTWTPSKRSI